MKRREFITLLGGAAASRPLAARAQQAAMPIMGFLRPGSPQEDTQPLVAFRQGLKEVGYIEGQNLTIEYRWGAGQYDRLRTLAAELVSHQVALIFAGSPPAALAAKSATGTIPIVFTSGADPVALGLVASLNRPGGNVTGVSFLLSSLGPKRLELLAELVPNARRLAALINPTLSDAENQLGETQDAANRLGRELVVLKPKTKTRSRAHSQRCLANRLERCISPPIPCSSAEKTISSHLQHAIVFRPCISIVNLPRPAVLSAMDQASWLHIVRQASTAEQSSKGRNPRTYPLYSQPSSS
jgi:hypothetical protein